MLSCDTHSGPHDVQSCFRNISTGLSGPRADVPLNIKQVKHYFGWWLGVVVSVVGRINEVNQHRARLVHDG